MSEHTPSYQTDAPKKMTLAAWRVPRRYTAVIRTLETRGRQTVETTILWEFMIACFGPHPWGDLGYRLETLRRCLLDTNNQPVRKPSKAQQIALKTAGINNKLVLRVNRHFGLLEVVNIDHIRQRWEPVKSWLLQAYPDAKAMADNFDWQLQDEHIQDLLHTDLFYQFFFAGIFDRPFPIRTRKTLANLLGSISLPVSQEITAPGRNPTTVEVTGELDTGAPI